MADQREREERKKVEELQEMLKSASYTGQQERWVEILYRALKTWPLSLPPSPPLPHTHTLQLPNKTAALGTRGAAACAG